MRGMSTVTLEYPRADAEVLAKAAFEWTEGFETYHDAGSRITGKTGGGLLSYGESVTVEFPDVESGADRTVMAIRADREVPINVTATPERYEQRYLETLNRLRGRPVDGVLAELESHFAAHGTREVTRERDQASGRDKLAVVLALTLLVTFCGLLLPVMVL